MIQADPPADWVSALNKTEQRIHFEIAFPKFDCEVGWRTDLTFMLEVNGQSEKTILGEGDGRIAVPNEASEAKFACRRELFDRLCDDREPVAVEEPHDRGGGKQGKDKLDC